MARAPAPSARFSSSSSSSSSSFPPAEVFLHSRETHATTQGVHWGDQRVKKTGWI